MAFDFGNANAQQMEAIQSTEGPLLIIAGPGTGKTFTLVKRIVYLITECHIAPEEIMVATFTEKAAKELITRVTNELLAVNSGHRQGHCLLERRLVQSLQASCLLRCERVVIHIETTLKGKSQISGVPVQKPQVEIRGIALQCL